jgi:hypothetical protein
LWIEKPGPGGIEVDPHAVALDLYVALERRPEEERVLEARVDLEVEHPVRRLRRRTPKRLGRGVGDHELGRHALGRRETELRVELAGRVEVAHDVATADQLALDVELRDRGPGRVHLDALTNRRIRENVDGLIIRKHAVQDLDGLGGKAALGLLAVPLHEEQHRVGIDERRDPVPGLGVEGHGVPPGVRET